MADLGAAGGQFTYSFGLEGAPAQYWQEQEARGEPVLRRLVEVLDLPFATRPVDGSVQYVWPSAFAYERWDEVPADVVASLRRVFSGDELRQFEQFGSYVGYRVGITDGGDWLFFVAGD